MSNLLFMLLTVLLAVIVAQTKVRIELSKFMKKIDEVNMRFRDELMKISLDAIDRCCEKTAAEPEASKKHMHNEDTTAGEVDFNRMLKAAKENRH